MSDIAGKSKTTVPIPPAVVFYLRMNILTNTKVDVHAHCMFGSSPPLAYSSVCGSEDYSCTEGRILQQAVYQYVCSIGQT